MSIISKIIFFVTSFLLIPICFCSPNNEGKSRLVVANGKPDLKTSIPDDSTFSNSYHFIDSILQSGAHKADIVNSLSESTGIRRQWKFYVYKRIERYLQVNGFKKDVELVEFIEFLFQSQHSNSDYFAYQCKQLSVGFTNKLIEYLKLCLLYDQENRKLYLTVMSSLCDPSLTKAMITIGEKEKDIRLLRRIISDMTITMEPASFSFIYKMLDHPNPELKYQAAIFFSKYNSPSAIPKLINLLLKEDYYSADTASYEYPPNIDRGLSLKCLVAEILGVIGDRKALPTLYKCANGNIKNLRVCSIHAISRIKDKTSVPVILNLLNSTDNDIIQTSLEAIDSIPDACFLNKLERIFISQSIEFRNASVKAIESIGTPAKTILLRHLNDSLFGEDIALTLLKIGDPKLLRIALKQLGKCYRCGIVNDGVYWGEFVPELYKIYSDSASIDSLLSIMECSTMNEKATSILEKIQNDYLLKQVHPFLKGDNQEKKIFALKIIHIFKDYHSTDEVISLLKDPVPVSLPTFSVLCSIYNKRYSETLYKYVTNFGNLSRNVKQDIKSFFGAPFIYQKNYGFQCIPDSAVQRTLLKEYLSGKPINFDFINIELINDTNLLTELLLKNIKQNTLTEADMIQVITQLGKLKAKNAILPLINFLTNKSKYLKNASVTALGEIGDHKAFISILKLLENYNRIELDDWYRERQTVIEALVKFNDTAAVPAIIHTLLHGTRNDRLVAADALVKLNDKRSIQPLQSCLNYPDGLMVEKAITALGYFPDSVSAELLIEKIDNNLAKKALICMGTNFIDKLSNSAPERYCDENIEDNIMMTFAMANRTDKSDLLTQALQSSNYKSRMNAAFGLGLLKLKSSTESLRKAKLDSVSYVRLAAIWALYSIGDTLIKRDTACTNGKDIPKQLSITLEDVMNNESKIMKIICTDSTGQYATKLLENELPSIRFIANYVLDNRSKLFNKLK